MTKAQTKLKIAETIVDLKSDSQAKMLGALKILETIGDKTVLPDLIDVLRKKEVIVSKVSYDGDVPEDTNKKQATSIAGTIFKAIFFIIKPLFFLFIICFSSFLP